MILMQMGNTGQRVVELQVRLNKVANFGLKVDGIFGAKTQAAVMELQQSRPANTGTPGPFGTANPPASGAVDDDTWAYLVRQSGPVSAPTYPTAATPAVYAQTKGASVSTENSYIQTGSGEPGPAPAPAGLVERLKQGFIMMPTWQKWAVIGGSIVAVLGVAYAASTPRKASLAGFVDFLNGDEPKPRTKRCSKVPGEGTLEDAEDVLPEA